MIKVAALTGGINVPAARFRIEQLIPALRCDGVDMDHFPALWGSYPPKGVLKRLVWLPTTIAERACTIMKTRRYDVTVFQRELVSTLPTVERLSKSPRVLDVDDAIWLYRGGLAANHIARLADYIVCGNSFLAEYFSHFGKPVTILPTAVNCQRYTPLAKKKTDKYLLGWSGTSGGLHYFRDIEHKIGKLLQEHQNWKLRIISDAPPDFRYIPPEKIEYIRWTPDDEVRLTQEIDIGLMPLLDTEWARGKCSYKMLLYMACGIPVVVSDVGMNKEVLSLGDAGYLASSPSQWTDMLTVLMTDETLRTKMGIAGRQITLNNFDLSMASSQWVKILRGLV